MEEVILASEVIARVDLLGQRTSLVQTSAPSGETWWLGTLEFRFRVHEYIKGSGPNEIGGIVFEPFASRAAAEASANVMSDEHDSRWDDREAIVFLDSDIWWYHAELGSGRYWFGEMRIDTADYGALDGYTVASLIAKRWLPEAQLPSGRTAQTVDERLFLLDAPATTTTSTPGGGVSAASVTPTISLGTLKSRIAALEAEANAGGTPQYRDCVENWYASENAFRRVTAEEGGTPWHRETVYVEAGLPAGALLDEFYSADGLMPNTAGRGWFNGSDGDLVRFEAVNFRRSRRSDDVWPNRATYTRRIVTARPLPVGSYVFYPNWVPPTADICNKPKFEDVWVFDMIVKASAETVHTAFFDPVNIGDAVGADGTNGVLKPVDFALNGVATTIQSLKWENGTVTMELSPSASLADFVIDFIDVTGTTTLSLTGNDSLTWSVAEKPWSDGDLIMMRIYVPVSANARLGNLVFSDVPLAFNPATTEYAVTVASNVTQTTVVPRTERASATYVIKKDGVVVAEKDGLDPVSALVYTNEGQTVITVEVTAGDRTTAKTYTITLTRPAFDQTNPPMGLSLVPGGDGRSVRVVVIHGQGNRVYHVQWRNVDESVWSELVYSNPAQYLTDIYTMGCTRTEFRVRHGQIVGLWGEWSAVKSFERTEGC